MNKPVFNGYDYRFLSLEEGWEIWQRREGFIFNSSLVNEPIVPGSQWEGRKAILRDGSACALFIRPRSVEARKRVREFLVKKWVDVHGVSKEEAEKVYHLRYPGKFKHLDLIFMIFKDEFVNKALETFPARREEFRAWMNRWEHVVEFYVAYLGGSYTQVAEFINAIRPIL